MKSSAPHSRILTVSEINRELSSLISGKYQFVRITGEVSNLRVPISGHHYFILKDDKSQIRAVLFKGQARYLNERLTDGQNIICDGKINVYEPRGEYQIIIDSIDFDGTGILQLKFEKLKQKLKSEGLFEQSTKRKGEKGF